MALALGKLVLLGGAALIGSVVVEKGRLPTVTESLTGAFKVLRTLSGGESGSSKSKSDDASVTQGINDLRHQLQLLESNRSSIVVVSSGSGAGSSKYSVIIVVVVVGYGYVWWKGWKLSDMMFATKRSLNDACGNVSKQLENVYQIIYANSLPKIENGSTSGLRISCFQCKESSSSSNQCRNGWRLCNGEFAKLCPSCASIFYQGRFCETFHSQEDGWRDCESCGKLVHCGCIASFSTHMLLDFGGVICIDCTRINLIQARNESLPVEIQQALSEKSAIESQYLPHCTPSELQQIPRNSGSVVTPLFEKQLTNTDAEVKLGRLVLPKNAIGSTGLDLKTDPGVPIVYTGFGALMLTTCVSFLSHSQIWGLQDGTTAVIGDMV